MHNRSKFVFLLFALVAALLAEGCSAGSSNTIFGMGGTNGSGPTTGSHSGPTTGAGGSTGSHASTGACMINCNSGAGTGGANPQGMLVISPANVTLSVKVGTPVPTQVFKAEVNGVDVTASVTWSYERPEIGDILTGSTFTPTGAVGGNGTLTAAYKKEQATTLVAVTITQIVTNVMLTPAQVMAFNNPSGGPDPASLVYPNDQTVYPLGVLAPDMQWNGSSAGDLYRLQLSEKYYTYVEYFNADPPAHHLMAEADWTNFESSGSGPTSDPVGVALTRMTGATAFQSMHQTWHVAQGRLHGSVYYWELPDQCGNQNAGRVLRIKPDSPTVDQFFVDQGECWGCHTVSRDGKKLAGEFNAGDGPLYTLDLSQNPVVFGDISPGKPSGNYIFSAFNNDGTKLLASNNPTRQLQILDAVTGTTLNPQAFPGNCGEPAWSPDGKKVAGICNMNGANSGWTFDSPSGDLMIADVTGTTVTNVQTIVPQGAVGGRPAYPTFSPGGNYLAYGRPTSGSRSTAPGDLWIVDPLTQATTKLATASTGDNSYNPVFAPLRAGGYYWLVFITRRDYGNQIVGADRQQLWITAVDDPPKPGMDPSHPGFYMRGQENCGKSENAYYALDPCKMLGASCVSGVDCCNGQCVKDPNTKMYVCGTPPPPGMCSQEGNSCKTKADCCNPSDDCIDGFCGIKPPT